MSCCFWWFLLGALLGWLFNWLLCKLTGCCSKKSHHVETNHVAQPVAAAPVADVKPAVQPVAAAAPVAEVKPAAKPAAVETKPVAATAYVLDKTAASAAGFKLKGPDDLTVIEGIGPKINGLFNAAGFHTFDEVSKMSIAQMQKILDEAGPRYRLARPDTWAKQAGLAANNKWAELKTLQDHLKHGV